MRALLLLVALLLAVPVAAAHASGGIVQDVPTLPVYAIALSSSSATPAPFQQELSLNLTLVSGLRSDLGNLRFYSAVTNRSGYLYLQNSSLLYGWLQSYSSHIATVWVKLPSGVGTGGVTVYMAVLPQNTTTFGPHWGEYPTATSTYGQWDNGPSVFSYYQNFNGTTFPSSLSSSALGGTYSVSNALTLSVPATSNDWIWVWTAGTFSQSVVEGDSIQSQIYYQVGQIVGTPSFAATTCSSSIPTFGYSGTASDAAGCYLTMYMNTTSIASASSNTLATGIYGFAWTTGYEKLTYSDSALTASNTQIPVQGAHQAIGIWNPIGTAYSDKLQWLRVRAAPPGGVMPSATVKFSGYGSFTDPQYQVNVYQEERPGTLDSNVSLTLTVQDGAGNSQSMTTMNGELYFNDSTAAVPDYVSIAGTTGFLRLYAPPPPWTQGTPNQTTVYYPFAVSDMQGYTVYFFGFGSSDRVLLYPGLTRDTLLWNSTIFTNTIPIPLMYGHLYTLVVVTGAGTEDVFAEAASTLSTFAVAPPFHMPATPGGITWNAIWMTNTTELQLTFLDPNNITTGSATVYTAQGSVVNSLSIPSGNWTVGDLIPFSQGMYACYSVTDVLLGHVAGCTPVTNSTLLTVGTLSLAGLPDIGLGSMFGPLGGVTYGELFSSVIVVLLAALFSQKHQDVGTLAVVMAEGFFALIGWLPVVWSFLSGGLIVAFLVFIRKGTAPMGGPEE